MSRNKKTYLFQGQDCTIDELSTQTGLTRDCIYFRMRRNKLQRPLDELMAEPAMSLQNRGKMGALASGKKLPPVVGLKSAIEDMRKHNWEWW